MAKSAPDLISDMRRTVDRIDEVLRNNLPADNQIADVNTLCWAIVDYAKQLQWRVYEDLSDTD